MISADIVALWGSLSTSTSIEVEAMMVKDMDIQDSILEMLCDVAGRSVLGTQCMDVAHNLH